MNRELIRIVVVFVVWAAGLAIPHAGWTSADGCESQRAAWISAYEKLAEAAELCRNLRQASLQPRLEEMMARRESGATLAELVGAALNERLAELAHAKTLCRQAVEQERLALIAWRNCLARSRQRNASTMADMQVAVREREKLLKEVEDLLLDEAYLQYKNYRPPAIAEEQPVSPPPYNPWYAPYGPYGPPPPFGYR